MSAEPARSSRSRVAMTVLAAVMTAAVAAFIALQLSPSLVPTGPTWAVGHAQHVWLLSHGGLHVLDANGRRVRHVRLADLGVTENASDLRPLTDDELMIHDTDRLLRCTISSSRCWPAATGLDAALRDKAGRKFDYDPVRHLLALSDVNHHRLHVFDLANGAARQIALDATNFRYPNQPRWIDGALWIADTNNLRLVKMAAPATEWSIDKSLSTRSRLLRPGRRFPFAFVQLPGGEFWVLVANHKMAQADILVIGSDGNASRRIPLSDDQDPVSLVAIGDKIVVPDMTRFSLTALDHGGNPLGEFGDAQFLAELARVREQAKWFDRAPWMLGGILVLCLGAGIALGVRSGEIGASRGVPWRRVDAGAAAPPSGQSAESASDRLPDATASAAPRVLEVLPAMRRRITASLAATLALIALAIGGALAMSHADLAAVSRLTHLTPNMRHLVWAMVLLVIGGIATGVYAVLAVARMRGLALTLDGERIGVRSGGRWRYAPLAQVVVTPTGMHVGGKRIPLRIGRAAMFDEPSLRRSIIDRLPDACIVASEREAFARLWTFGGFRLRAAMAIVVLLIMIAMVLQVAMWR